MHPGSIWYAFKKYKRDGYRWVNRMKGNFKPHHVKRRKITGIIADYLRSQATLESWSQYNIVERCKLLEQQTGLRVERKTLMAFYHRHGIKFRAVGFRY